MSERSRSDRMNREGTGDGPRWRPSGDYGDIRYEVLDGEGVAKITICRPEVRNAFRPRTLFELSHAFNEARDDPDVGVIILTGEGTEAFCSGGDQRVRGDDGYKDDKGIGRLNVLDLQVQIRRTPKPVVAMVAGYAIGGGHVLHVVCDLTIAADNARFGQTGPRVGSFDGGFGATVLARAVGVKKAQEMWFICRQYSADEAVAVALAIQVGTNYANDYHDGIRGTDDTRVGPVRLVASKLATPAAVRRAAMASFAVAGVAGLALAAATTWWLLLVGAASFAAG